MRITKLMNSELVVMRESVKFKCVWARRGWECFMVEREGGFRCALMGGFWHRKLEAN